MTATKFALLSLIFATAIQFSVDAQTPRPQEPKPDTSAKATQILNDGLAALGGQAYLDIRSSVGRGQYTQFQDGVSGNPNAFVDYVVYPDKERTEFKGGRAHVIQVNSGNTGWMFDAAAKSLRDLPQSQIDEFKFTVRTSLENVLRGGWRADGAKLSYLGRREAGVGRRNDAIKITYPDGLAIELEFGAVDHLPARLMYKRKKGDAENETAEEDRFAQFTTIQGARVPFIVDHFVDGKQASRLNYQSMEFNTSISDSLFQKPESIKGLK